MEGNTSRKGKLDEPDLMEKEEKNIQHVTGEKRSASVQETTQSAKRTKTLHPLMEECKRYAHVTSFNIILASSSFG